MTTAGITRLAPSPTGALHLGNIRTFLINAALAGQHGWQTLMRIEDLDTPRTKTGADTQVLEELTWLGLSWDGPILYQTQRAAVYQSHLETLVEKGLAYPCICSRRDIESAASAPHAEDHITTYPGTCRDRFSPADITAGIRRPDGTPPAWRLKVPDAPITVHDRFAGKHTFDLRHCGGDFVIMRNNGTAAYQLAVTIDDALSGVNRIVRGDDLLDSAARQIYLRSLLGFDAPVTWYHVPLVIGTDGRRLAKRHGDTRISFYRQHGCTPERIIGLSAYYCGIIPAPAPMDLGQFIDRFDIATLGPHAVVFTPQHNAFLQC